MSLTALFMLLFGLFIASYRVFRRRPGWGSYGGLNPPGLEAALPSPITFEPPLPQPPFGSGGGLPQWVNPWVTKLFIAIVLQCAALYLLSQFPGFECPFWLGIVLQGYTYGSAALFYASGRDDPTGY
jgi:hypothetical protein